MNQPSNPNWAYNYVPSAGEWNNTFSGKVDYPAPVGQGGTGAVDAPTGNYNLQQRIEITTSTATAAALTLYACRTDLNAIAIALPPAAAMKPGDWIEVLDCGNNAAVNSITINGSGSDEIYLYATAATSQQIDVNDGGAIFVCIGTAWRMWSMSSPAPAATSLTGTETWNIAKNGVVESITPALLAAYVGSPSHYVQWAPWFNGTPLANELLALWTPALSFTFPANFVGSVATRPVTLPSSTFVLSVNHIVSGTSTVVGTVTVNTGGSVVFATTGGAIITVAAGDQLTVTGPAVTDATITGFSMTLLGTNT